MPYIVRECVSFLFRRLLGLNRQLCRNSHMRLSSMALMALPITINDHHLPRQTVERDLFQLLALKGRLSQSISPTLAGLWKTLLHSGISWCRNVGPLYMCYQRLSFSLLSFSFPPWTKSKYSFACFACCQELFSNLKGRVAETAVPWNLDPLQTFSVFFFFLLSSSFFLVKVWI